MSETPLEISRPASVLGAFSFALGSAMAATMGPWSSAPFFAFVAFPLFMIAMLLVGLGVVGMTVGNWKSLIAGGLASVLTVVSWTAMMFVTADLLLRVSREQTTIAESWLELGLPGFLALVAGLSTLVGLIAAGDRPAWSCALGGLLVGSAPIASAVYFVVTFEYFRIPLSA